MMKPPDCSCRPQDEQHPCCPCCGHALPKRPCACCECPRPQPRPCAQGLLLPRMVASGREWLRRQCFRLELEGLPACPAWPLTLQAVCPCGEPAWTPLPWEQPRQIRLRMRIPLLCQLQDCRGCQLCCRAWIDVDTCLSHACPRPECWRSHLLIQPCVRLVCPACAESPCIDAQLEVLLETFLVRWEACAAPKPNRPACPELPLYPQPCME